MNDLEVGKDFPLEVKRLGINGEGIAYYKKKAVFIEGALPGEKVIAMINEETPKYYKADVVKILNASPERVEPTCELFNRCGGCQTMHLSNKGSNDNKRELIINAINRYTKLNTRSFEIKKTISKEQLGYRNKSSLILGYNGENHVYCLYEKNSNRRVFLQECCLQHELVNKVNSKILKYIDNEGITAYNPKEKRGVIKNVVTRVSTFTNTAQVTFIVTEHHKKLNFLAKDLIKVKDIDSIYIDIHDKDHEVGVFSHNTIHLEGEKYITEKVGNFKFNLMPNSFFQVNVFMIEELFNQVKKAAKLSRQELVLDAYSGVGTIGIWLSKLAKEVRGVDNIKEAIINANENIKINKVKNATYVTGEVDKVLPKWIKEGFIPDVVVVDPPRGGLSHDFINIMQQTKPKRIVYVSCNPATLAKNLDRLSDNYKVKYIQPLDMFPHTSHIESVTLLELKK